MAAFHNRFGPLVQLVNPSTAVRKNILNPSILGPPPSHLGPILASQPTPPTVINASRFGGKSMAIAAPDPKPKVGSNLSHPYRDALLRNSTIIPPAPPKPLVTSFWQRKGSSSSIDKASYVRSKLASLRAASSPSSPICLRCGDRGHLASQCRNAVLCFLCNRFGHRARWCKATTELPPPLDIDPRPASLPINSSLPIISSSQSSPPRTDMHRHTSMNAPVARFYSTPDSEALEQHFRQSFFLDDPHHWGPEKIERLFHAHPLLLNYAWKVRIFEDQRYLIEAPNSHWLDRTLENGFIRLENKDFPVSAWDPGFIECLKLISIWVKVRGFPSHL
ncbi:Zinc knuckle [Carex littledalei]|uniref:Zinc knuckle n=1 Tax=Carex littledalei TaxID=544730 RepID=A0A833VTU1_9POAL|nr:Zinc knuckle [Carex littledalei]